MKVGENSPESALELALGLVAYIHQQDKKKEIAVLTCLKSTVRALQKKINGNIRTSKLLVETIARVQGLTTDVCIFVIPNHFQNRSLESRLFNVATSRARYQTIIIADKNILGCSRMNENVRKYLEKLNKENSFYLPFNPKKTSFLEVNQSM